MEVVVGPLPRVVGHATLDVSIDGSDVNTRLKVTNDPKFIEAIVIGRRADEVPEIASRICGPCSISHTLASILALEHAMAVEPREEVRLLRRLLCHAVNIQNHAVHLYFLALPDYLGYASVTELARNQPETARTGMKLKTYGNRLAEAIAGRVVHPNACLIGGFTKTPTKEKLEATVLILEEARRYVLEAVDLFLDLDLPPFESPRELHMTTYPEQGYPSIGDKLSASDGVVFSSAEYEAFLKEEVRRYSTSKCTLMNGLSFYVGSRARVNQWHERLTDDAREYVRKLGLPLGSPFDNIPAKAIELLHFVDESIEILETVRGEEIRTKAEAKLHYGEGVGTLEAPRGTLLHHYKVARNGTVSHANIITPTAFNARHIEEASQKLVEESLEERTNDEELKYELGRLIRAYDPCLGCATHLIQVNLQRRRGTRH